MNPQDFQKQQPGAMNKAQETTSDLADQARQKSTEVLQQAQDTAKTTIDQQKGKAADTVSTVADALRQTSKSLHENDQGTFGRVIDQAADRLEQFSDDLQNKSVDEMFNEVQSFARRDPQLFLGGAVVLGLLAARFLKSSSSRRQQQYNYNYGGQYGASSGRYYQGGTQPGGYSGYTQRDLADYRSQTVRDEFTGSYGGDYDKNETGFTAASGSSTSSTTGSTGANTYESDSGFSTGMSNASSAGYSRGAGLPSNPGSSSEEPNFGSEKKTGGMQNKPGQSSQSGQTPRRTDK